MKILGFDSSGMVASVAIACDDILVAEYSVNYKKTHSQTLLPMFDAVVSMTELDLDSVDGIAVAAGPGSFTGLRIGMSTVKGLGLALDKPVVAVPTCHALAYNLWGSDKLICPILDARRSQVYTALYEFKDEEMITIKEQDAMDINDLIDIINNLDRDVIFVGDGIPVFKERIEEKIKNKAYFAPAHLNRQRAGSVAALGMIYMKEGKAESADDVKPVYLRKSQAEREREEKDGRR
ncbi:MAG: tRNA (adenosine(37)-N6)-threonylcarbamoyltransferase complex dimerization subunit type 1 TsaB [Lachnospiraceae bacterium]|nr:tRNA (adenosine(37)-N6)-threonylcarbamoyltransferase complex dimerization subunit type 1 TsaB [Lachnospiraceae bacterium]